MDSSKAFCRTFRVTFFCLYLAFDLKLMRQNQNLRRISLYCRPTNINSFFHQRKPLFGITLICFDDSKVYGTLHQFILHVRNSSGFEKCFVEFISVLNISISPVGFAETIVHKRTFI